MPPSTAIDCAVMWLARSDSRKHASSASSSAVPMRPMRHALTHQSRILLRRWLGSSCMSIGRLDEARDHAVDAHVVRTRLRSRRPAPAPAPRAWRRRRPRCSASRARWQGCPSLRCCPRGAAIIAGRTRLIAQKTLVRLVRKHGLEHLIVDTRPSGAKRPPVPALANSPSIGPKRRSGCSDGLGQC